MNAKRFLSKRERKTLEEAVAAAEQRTAAEFVCAVATESGRYDRAESLVGLAVGLVGLAVVHFAFTWTPSDSWFESRAVPLALQAAAVVAGFVLGSVLASFSHALRRLFVSASELEAEVERAASHVFAVGRLASTRQRGGVLVYVSVFERRVVVLADSGAARLLGEDGIDALRNLATERLTRGKRLEAFTDTVGAAAERLAPALPAEAVNPDELPDALLVFHPRP